ncbi:MAG: transglutaminase family protein [Myxococcota bacterium]
MEIKKLIFVPLILAVACRSDAVDPRPPPSDGAVALAEPNDETKASQSEASQGDEGRWYNFIFKGQKVGYMHAREDSVTWEGAPAFHVTRASVLEVKRRDSSIRMQSNIQAWVRPDGRPLRFTHRRVEGELERQLSGRARGDQFVIEIKVGKDVTRTSVPLDDQTILASASEAVFFKQLAPGFKKTGRAISESEGDVSPFRIEVLDVIPGGGFIVEEETAGILSRSRVDASGIILETELPALGARFTRTSRSEALAIGAKVDIFAAGLFSVPHPLPRNNDIEHLVVWLETRSGQEPIALEDERQQVERNGSRAKLMLRATELPARTAAIPVEDPKVREYLEGTPFEKLDDPQLVKAAKKAIGDASEVGPAARRLTELVHERLERKNLTQAFTSASEAWRQREGDCTEHSVLFSALAKIVGIPTRLVTGLVYVGGVRNQFGYHEWVEVWTGAGWHPMDPTFGQANADPTHIKFAVGQSDPASLREAGVVAATLIGDLELSVVSYATKDGRQVMLQ